METGNDIEHVAQTFAERLRNVRKDLGKTQAEMAEALGYNRMTYVYYEGAKRTPDIEFLDKLIRYTGYSAEYFLGHTDNRKPEALALDHELGLEDNTIRLLRFAPYLGRLVNFLLGCVDAQFLAKSVAASLASSYQRKCAASRTTARLTLQEFAEGSTTKLLQQDAMIDAERKFSQILVYNEGYAGEVGAPLTPYERRCEALINAVAEYTKEERAYVQESQQ